MINKAIKLFENNKLDESLELLNDLSHKNPEDENLHFLIGKVYFRKQEWGRAINSFTRVLEINPSHREAISQAEIARQILEYFTPDMFNP